MRLRALAALAAVLLVPTSVASAHTPLKSVTPKKNSTQHKAVKEVRATFKAKMQTGIIAITTSSGSTVALKSSGLISLQQGGRPRGPEDRAAAPAPTRSAGAPAPATATPRRAPGRFKVKL